MAKVKFFPLIILILGILILIQVITPIAKYKLWEISSLENTNLVSPVYSGSQILGISIKSQDNFPAFISDAKRIAPATFSSFNMSIPKLNIKEAKVLVDNNDLDKGPSLLPGTALPGERGNGFISSHSSVLFNNNFSRLNSLKTGDEIKLKVEDLEFTYVVIHALH